MYAAHTSTHQVPTDVFTPHKEEEEREEDLVVEEKESPRSQELASGLLESPALKFITRKDLYTFLSSAGVRGIRMGREGCGERNVHGEGCGERDARGEGRCGERDVHGCGRRICVSNYPLHPQLEQFIMGSSMSHTLVI